MKLFAMIRSWVNGILGRRRIEREMADELQFHIERRAEDLISTRGLSQEKALRLARIELGSIEKYKEEGREALGLRLFDELHRDIKYAIRMLRKNPGFTLVAVMTLALGIGANTAIFSVVDAVVLRTLSYRDAGQLVAIHEVVPKFGLIPVSALHFLEWRKTARSFEEMALVAGFSSNLTGASEPERVDVGRVSPTLFPMLGVQAQIGRTFLRDDDKPGHGQVVVIGDGLWRRRFAADTAVVGRTLRLDDTPYEIIGVLPAGFHFPKISDLYSLPVAAERPEIWIPFVVEPREVAIPFGLFNYACIARLKAGVSPAQAVAELKPIQAGFASQAPQQGDLGANLIPLQDQIVSRSRRGLQLILAAVGMVLLIGCVNITNLLLARTSTRTREMAIRAAIGASRGRLVRQMLVEAMVLSGFGALCGLVIAYAAIPLILTAAPADIPRLDEVHLNTRVLLFAVTISTLTGLVIGLLPARRSAKTDLQLAVASGSRTTWSRRSGRIRSVLVSVEVALTVTCLIAGGLLLHSFVKLVYVDSGFDSEHIITVDVNLGRGDNGRYPNVVKQAAFVSSTLDRLREIPGVISVGVSDRLPLSGSGQNDAMIVEGQDVPAFERPMAAIRGVNIEYFPTLGMSLARGRLFDESDRNRRLVAVISSAAAERAWPGENPIGKQFRFLRSNPYEVIGIVNDVRGDSLEKTPPLHVYLPYWQPYFRYVHFWFAVKTAGDPLLMSSTIRSAIREIDRELPLPEFRTMDDIVAGSLGQRRFQMNLVLLFALAAIVLASLGIYGVMSYTVAQRTNEIGIRVALGAGRTSVLRMVLVDALQLVAGGLVMGLPLALAAAFFLRSFLFGVAPNDWMTLIGACMVLTGAAALAAYLPALKASRVDPLVALKYE
jgi:predicted permease